MLKVSVKAASGLKWRKAKSEKPSNGQELMNEKLAEALATKTEFTQAEWDAFGIEVLHMDHFIQSGASCFQPAEVGDGEQGGTSQHNKRRVRRPADGKRFIEIEVVPTFV